MRELTVYYCSKCGRYGFYQVARNAVCPVCGEPMTLLPMRYQSFMDLDHAMRDQLIADQIAKAAWPKDSVVQRITEPEKSCGGREEAARRQADRENLELELQTLRRKNEELEQTVKWMHDMIWDLTRRLHSEPPKE